MGDKEVKDIQATVRRLITTTYNKLTAATILGPEDANRIEEVIEKYQEWQDMANTYGEVLQLDANEEDNYHKKIMVLKELLLTIKPTLRKVPDEMRQDIKIRPFSGKYIDFLSWIAQFKATFGGQPELSDGDKCQALKNLLDEKTSRMVYHCSNSKDGYEEALSRLNKYFDNEKQVVRECFNELRDLKLNINDSLEYIRNVLIITDIASRFNKTSPDIEQTFSFIKLVMQKLPNYLVDRFAFLHGAKATLEDLGNFLTEAADYVKIRKELKPSSNNFKRIGSKTRNDKSQTCNYCHKPGHFFSDCKTRLNQTCFKCGDKGHIAKICSNKDKKMYSRVCVTNKFSKEKTMKLNWRDSCKDPRVFTTMKVGNTSVKTLVDPGSVATFVPKHTIQEDKGPITEFGMADGTSMKAYGPFEKQIKIGNYPHLKWPIYAQNTETAILGADYLKEHSATIDMATGKVTLKNVKTVTPDVNSINNKIASLVTQYENIFNGIGLCNRIHHDIDTGNNNPICLGSRRIPYAQMEALDKHVNDLLEKDIIESCNSDWCSPINPRTKKDGTIRLTIDYRELNNRTRWDAWPMPRVDEILNKLTDARWFSRVDLRSGYYNIPLKESSKEKTAFRYRNRLYQFKRMPMGLVTAPQTFQRLMTTIFGDLPYVECYLDDVIIYSKTADQHISHLEVVLKRFQEANLKLNREKCQFGVNEIEILGSKIREGRRYPDNEKLNTMSKFPIPENSKQTKAFLGFANYLRSLIPNFATITRPLVELSNTNKFKWSPECQQSFDKIKKLVAANPMTFLPDLNKPFIVTSDASDTAMGATLSQIIDNEKRVIEFASKHFTPTQQRYSTIEKEATAIIFALRKWRHFLLGQEITIETDHRPLQWLMTKRDCPDKLGRMAAELQEYRIKDITYIKGESNIMADTLSRLQIAVINQPPNHVDTRIRTLAMKFPNKYVREGERIIMIDHPFRRVCIETQDERKYILHKLHDEEGHLSYDKTIECIRKRFYWPNWQKHVKDYLKQCQPCAMKKDDIEPIREKLKPQASNEPMERVHLDICGQLTPSRNKKYFAVMVDAFTKWTEAQAFSSVSASDIIRWLRQVFRRLGTPKQITTDHGSQFDSNEFRLFCNNIGTELHLTTVGHHESNGLAEREIQTIEKMLRTSIDEQQDWSLVLQRCVKAYNSRKHASTGFSPHVLMFGQEPILEIDREYGLALPRPNIDEARGMAKINVQRQMNRAKVYYNRKYKPNRIKLGDKVLWHAEEIGRNKSRKLNRRWKGPFLVTNITKPLATVTDSLGQRRAIHLNQLKIFNTDKPLDTFRGRGRPRNAGEV